MAMNFQERERVREDDTVFLALTRPPMAYGIPHQAFSWTPAITFTLVILLRNPLWAFAIAPGCFLAFRLLTAWDYHFARRIGIAVQTRFASLNAGRWGGATISPRPLTRPRHPEDLTIHA